MRSKLETAVWTLLLTASMTVLSFVTSADASAPTASPKSAQATAAPQQPAAAPAKVVRRRQRPRAAQAGVPKGVQNCIDALIKIAEKDPLVEYGGRAEKIINEGLMWNDPKSNCYAGDDASLRKKMFDLVNAWRTKDGSSVRSMLQDIKSSAPQS